tara:strand:- start:394 stop:1044 length:651 start_codon:yes stop_codon:yes gene_type:complete
MFSDLHVYSSDSDNNQSSRENEIRKAKKKLKAIEKLKYKNNLTQEEKIKLQNEPIFLRVIDPAYISPEERRCSEQAELKHQHEKLKKSMKRDKLMQSKVRRNEEQRRRNEEKQRQCDEEQRRRDEEQRKRNEEQHQRNEEQRQRNEEHQRQLNKQQKKSGNLERKIINEFDKLLTSGCSRKKARHIMLGKYHPDKNYGNEIRATKITCIVNNIKLD